MDERVVSVPPWAGPARATWIADAVRRSHTIDELPDLRAIPELFTGRCPSSLVAFATGPRDGLRCNYCPTGRHDLAIWLNRNGVEV
jgi:hypothetical protein